VDKTPLDGFAGSMSTGLPELSEADAVTAALALADTPGRTVLGITGAPGAGKSTFAELLVAAVNRTGRSAALVPMDGFHLAQSALESLGLADVKGAPATFDAAGYLELLRRVREPADEVIWAPRFDRDLEDSIAASLPIEPTVELVVTEGNYLLLPRGQWWLVRLQLDACWFIDVPDDVRRERLQARHERHGRTPADAAERTFGSDEANARLVQGTRGEADAVVRVTARD
jgi:pantothenate kinase